MIPPAARLLSCAMVAVALGPASAAAQGPSGGSPGGATAPPTGGAPAAPDGGYSFAARPAALLGRIARLEGTVPASDRGASVRIERFDELSRQWTAIARTVAADDGTFLARWRTDRVGRLRLRAQVERPQSARAASAPPEVAVTVHRPATATWYGPGFYGRRTACGQRMTRRLLGVAHKRLPCGTSVSLLYKGRTIEVPVVDRGPFRRGTSWDLTAATAKALRFRHTATVGAVRIR